MKRIFFASLILSIAAALCIGAYADAAQTTYRCETMADTYLDQRSPDSNYGTGTSLRVIPSTVNEVCRSIIRYNIPPFVSAGQIVSATAYFWNLRNASVTADFYALELPPAGENWWEKPGTDPKKGDFFGATWKISGGYDNESFWASWDNDTQTGGGGDYDNATVATGVIGPSSSSWSAIDLTALLTGNLDKVRKHGILIKVQDESTSAFQRVSSREDAAHQPYLELVVDLGLPATQYLCPTISDVYVDAGFPDSYFYHKTRNFLASQAGSKLRARALWQFEIPASITAGQIDTAILHLSGAINAGGTGGAVYCHNLNAPFI